MIQRRRKPTHPGEILQAEFMKPMGLSANKLAQILEVPTNRITMIVTGKRGITADTALRLADALGTTPEFWTNLQAHYNLEMAKRTC